ncbi:SulP family inorganic anion transporter [Micromonospora sp. NBS 11-29]|uniref:SulP family inorganic anion transporter n=1 Tax=Micromonospora sp. NBS 11-29 TaxID=1960879 RepID=UPI0020CDF696|nr:SulP family inorganic anion transporter [Micromonospora sp. NBS 11-29]
MTTERAVATGPAPRTRSKRVPIGDLPASLVVFLVALPLCVGIAVASGAPAELGLVTGIVGGLVAGALPGSSLQVSGPAAGLTVLVADAIDAHGLAGLGVIVLVTGLLQVLLGVCRLGRWFQAISLSVVEGMLAGIGLVIISGQLYALADQPVPHSGPSRIAGLVELPSRVAASPASQTALIVGAATLAVLVSWPRLPRRVRVVPGPLAAVVLATVAAAALTPPVTTVRVGDLLDAVAPPGADSLALLTSLAGVGTIVAFTLIASAESLFSAAAVDRMHDGPRTDFDRELIAQGAGNTVCGLLGALPMTAVIVRSATNVQAGARTKASRVLHGCWLLLFAALLPWTLELIPVAALAAVLVHAGAKLLPVRSLASLWSRHRGEAVVLLVTATGVVALNLFEGVLIGLLLAVVKSAWDSSRLHAAVEVGEHGAVRVRLSGTATFLRLPTVMDALDAVPARQPAELDLTGVHHLDHACRTALERWMQRHSTSSSQPVRVRADRS